MSPKLLAHALLFSSVAGAVAVPPTMPTAPAAQTATPPPPSSAPAVPTPPTAPPPTTAPTPTPTPPPPPSANAAPTTETPAAAPPPPVNPGAPQPTGAAPSAPGGGVPAPSVPAPGATVSGATVPGATVSQEGGIAELEGFLEPFLYDIVNRRDPFQPWSEYIPNEDTGPTRALSPAQRWELEKLKLIGIMWDIRDPKAMFLDPDGDVMILGRDESIGNKNGYIAAIREGEVVVVEAVRKRGDLVYRTRVLRIER